MSTKPTDVPNGNSATDMLMGKSEEELRRAVASLTDAIEEFNLKSPEEQQEWVGRRTPGEHLGDLKHELERTKLALRIKETFPKEGKDFVEPELRPATSRTCGMCGFRNNADNQKCVMCGEPFLGGASPVEPPSEEDGPATEAEIDALLSEMPPLPASAPSLEDQIKSAEDELAAYRNKFTVGGIDLGLDSKLRGLQAKVRDLKALREPNNEARPGIPDTAAPAEHLSRLLTHPTQTVAPTPQAALSRFFKKPVAEPVRPPAPGEKNEPPLHEDYILPTEVLPVPPLPVPELPQITLEEAINKNNQETAWLEGISYESKELEKEFILAVNTENALLLDEAISKRDELMGELFGAAEDWLVWLESLRHLTDIRLTSTKARCKRWRDDALYWNRTKRPQFVILRNAYRQKDKDLLQEQEDIARLWEEQLDILNNRISGAEDAVTDATTPEKRKSARAQLIDTLINIESKLAAFDTPEAASSLAYIKAKREAARKDYLERYRTPHPPLTPKELAEQKEQIATAEAFNSWFAAWHGRLANKELVDAEVDQYLAIEGRIKSCIETYLEKSVEGLADELGDISRDLVVLSYHIAERQHDEQDRQRAAEMLVVQKKSGLVPLSGPSSRVISRASKKVDMRTKELIQFQRAMQRIEQRERKNKQALAILIAFAGFLASFNFFLEPAGAKGEGSLPKRPGAPASKRQGTDASAPASEQSRDKSAERQEEEAEARKRLEELAERARRETPPLGPNETRSGTLPEALEEEVTPPPPPKEPAPRVQEAEAPDRQNIAPAPEAPGKPQEPTPAPQAPVAPVQPEVTSPGEPAPAPEVVEPEKPAQPETTQPTPAPENAEQEADTPSEPDPTEDAPQGEETEVRLSQASQELYDAALDKIFGDDRSEWTSLRQLPAQTLLDDYESVGDARAELAKVLRRMAKHIDPDEGESVEHFFARGIQVMTSEE